MHWGTVGGKASVLGHILDLTPSSVTGPCGEETSAGKVILISSERMADWIRDEVFQVRVCVWQAMFHIKQTRVVEKIKQSLRNSQPKIHRTAAEGFQ